MTIKCYISGFCIEEHDNPADFFLDVILGNVESTTPERLKTGNDNPKDAVVVFAEEESTAEKVLLYNYKV